MTRLKTEIIVHCTATRPDWLRGQGGAARVAEVKRWHVKDWGWRDIGYNALGDRDGKRYGGRDLDNDGDTVEETGAHTLGHNSGTIGYALMGGFGSAATDKFEDHFTPEQDADLRAFIREMEDRYGPLKLSGHNQYANKACPGFNVEEWYARDERPARTSLVDSTSLRTAAMGVVSSVGMGGGAISQLEGHNQTIAIVFIGVIVLMFMYLIKERIRHWTRGVR